MYQSSLFYAGKLLLEQFTTDFLVTDNASLFFLIFKICYKSFLLTCKNIRKRIPAHFHTPVKLDLYQPYTSTYLTSNH